MIVNENPEYIYLVVAEIVYSVMMVMLIIFFMMQCHKMEKLHRRRMELVKELDELMESVLEHRNELVHDIAELKAMRDIIEKATDDESPQV